MPRVRDGLFEVVFVCTGNRARSPLAEALLRRRLDPGAVCVRSLGTLSVGPVPALVEISRLAFRVGADLSHHRAQALRPCELEETDLVVGFEPGHVSTAVVDGGADVSKTFSLIELGGLLERHRAERLGMESHSLHPAATIQGVHALRTGGFLTAPALADPYGGSDEAFARTFETIDRHVATIADLVFGVASWRSRSPDE